MNKKKITIISLILVDIIIIGIAVALTINLIKINKKETENQNRIENKIENTKNNNVIENKVANEINNNTVENKTENTTHTHEEEPIADPEQEIDKTTIQKQETNQEKAISIAKEDWGEDTGVVFIVDNVDSDGIYKVDVIDDRNRHVIETYKININTGEIIQ